jgi:hypothetical protein
MVRAEMRGFPPLASVVCGVQQVSLGVLPSRWKSAWSAE